MVILSCLENYDEESYVVVSRAEPRHAEKVDQFHSIPAATLPFKVLYELVTLLFRSYKSVNPINLSSDKKVKKVKNASEF
jgi:hypothetical protein